MSIQADIVKTLDYENLLDSIDNLWGQARARAVDAVNTELLEANWETGRHIVEFEQKGNLRAEYGANLLDNLSRDLTIRKGKGFSRSNLTYMRKLYVMFPKRETLSHKLTWSHYFELLKCDDELELHFYFNEAINQKCKFVSRMITRRLALCLAPRKTSCSWSMRSKASQTNSLWRNINYIYLKRKNCNNNSTAF